ncbi:hypothetical protein [Mycobacterium tuberculosis]
MSNLLGQNTPAIAAAEASLPPCSPALRRR